MAPLSGSLRFPSHVVHHTLTPPRTPTASLFRLRITLQANKSVDARTQSVVAHLVWPEIYATQHSLRVAVAQACQLSLLAEQERIVAAAMVAAGSEDAAPAAIGAPNRAVVAGGAIASDVSWGSGAGAVISAETGAAATAVESPGPPVNYANVVAQGNGASVHAPALGEAAPGQPNAADTAMAETTGVENTATAATAAVMRVIEEVEVPFVLPVAAGSRLPRRTTGADGENGAAATRDTTGSDVAGNAWGVLPAGPAPAEEVVVAQPTTPPGIVENPTQWPAPNEWGTGGGGPATGEAGGDVAGDVVGVGAPGASASSEGETHEEATTEDDISPFGSPGTTLRPVVRLSQSAPDVLGAWAKPLVLVPSPPPSPAQAPGTAAAADSADAAGNNNA